MDNLGIDNNKEGLAPGGAVPHIPPTHNAPRSSQQDRLPLFFLVGAVGFVILCGLAGTAFILLTLFPSRVGGNTGQMQAIAFVSNREGNDEIYLMNADASNPRNLTENPANDLYPAWSPDGRQIAFAPNRDGNEEIYVMNADGSNPRNLTNNPALDSGAAWSPDGRQIAFTSTRDGYYEIYVMNADGSNPRRLTNNPAADHDPAWSPLLSR